MGQPCPYQAMGGITGFSSLLPGMARMDPSGAARSSLTSAERDASINDNDHPILRALKPTVERYEELKSKHGEPKGMYNGWTGVPANSID